jgi:hypothetical protein
MQVHLNLATKRVGQLLAYPIIRVKPKRTSDARRNDAIRGPGVDQCVQVLLCGQSAESYVVDQRYSR